MMVQSLTRVQCDGADRRRPRPASPADEQRPRKERVPGLLGDHPDAQAVLRVGADEALEDEQSRGPALRWSMAIFRASVEVRRA